MREKVTPADIARPIAETIITRGTLDGWGNSAENNPFEHYVLSQLEETAVQQGMLDVPYYVESGRSLLAPATFEADETLSVYYFDDLHFRGELKTYSTVRLGRLLGGQTMRALCLTFDNVTLFPGFDSIPEADLLHVPVLAVRDMDRLPHQQ